MIRGGGGVRDGAEGFVYILLSYIFNKLFVRVKHKIYIAINQRLYMEVELSIQQIYFQNTYVQQEQHYPHKY